MTYKDGIQPWAVYRVGIPSKLLLARFKKRTDAEEYAKLLKGNTSFNFQVIFDV